jgi:hypothetical protein
VRHECTLLLICCCFTLWILQDGEPGDHEEGKVGEVIDPVANLLDSSDDD